MGRELVLFRTASGVASLLDAYCVHIGTHMGHGGAVDGECLRCPFHRWGFGPSGACVDIPYARKIPPQARVRSYPLVERNGALFAWFHPDGAPPDFEIPEFPTVGWSPSRWQELSYPLHIQEIAENGIDIAHFPAIHRSARSGLELLQSRGIPFHFILKTAYEGDGIGVPGQTVNVSTDWTYWGMGMFYGVSTADDYGTQIRHMFHFTPIPGDRVLFRIATSVNLATVPAELVDYVQQKSAELTVRNLDDDAPIWARKRYLVRPVLCEGDGPYALLRRWTRQFLPEPRRVEGASQDNAPPAELMDERAGGLYHIASEQVARSRATPTWHVATPRPAVAATTTAGSASESSPPATPAPEVIDVTATPEEVRRVFFERLPSQFNPAAVSGPFVVQYDITGDSGGAYFVEVDSGRCSPAAGEHEAPAVRVSVDAGDWLRLQEGLLDGATAFLSGRIKIEGDLGLAMKLAEVFPLASRVG